MVQRSDTCFASTLLPRRAPRQFVSSSASGDSGRLGALSTGGMSSNARAPRHEGCSPVPFMASLMDPRAVKAQARFPRCSSVCGCTVLAVLRSGPELCCPETLEIRSVMCPISHRWSRCVSSEFLSTPSRISARSRRQRKRQSRAQDW